MSTFTTQALRELTRWMRTLFGVKRAATQRELLRLARSESYCRSFRTEEEPFQVLRMRRIASSAVNPPDTGAWKPPPLPCGAA